MTEVTIQISLCFNPRTRKGCDLYPAILLQFYFVSIHAPVKDATVSWPCIICRQCFNPRTRKGCDGLVFTFTRDEMGFNPRTRKGCDTVIVYSSGV